MAEEREDEPKIRIVDRRMLSEDERQGKAPAADTSNDAPPKLEIIGGGTSNTALSAAADESIAETDETSSELGDLDGLDDELSEEEAEQLRQELEEEQFAEIERRMGRPLTAQEKDSVRGEMDRQAQSAASLEVGPMLVQLMAEMSARAAVHLGLMPNPYTRLIARNDTQARLAIDAYGAVLQVIKTQLDPQSAREFERVLNDLRVNFVSITGITLPNNPSGPGGFGGPRIIH